MNGTNAHLSRSQKRALRQVENDVRAVLDHEPSLRFLCRMLEECGYDLDPFEGNSNATFRRLGLQEAGRRIVRALTAVDDTAQIKLLAVAARNRAEVARKEEDKRDED